MKNIHEKIKVYLEQKAGISCIREHHFYKGNLNANSVVVDLGANKGDFSKGINNEFHCKIYAVEPAPALFCQIPETDTIKKSNHAISGENGPTALYLSDNPEANTIEPYLQKLCGHRESITVNAVTLESFLKEIGITSVDLLKIDIEGAEVAMFKSVSDATLQGIKQISIEMHAFAQRGNVAYTKPYEELIQRFLKSGFMLLGSDDMDMLFLNKKVMHIKFTHRLFIWALSFLRLLYKIAKKIFLRERN